MQHSSRRRLRKFVGIVKNGTIINPYKIESNNIRRELEALDEQDNWAQEQQRRDEDRKQRKLERRAYRSHR
jgi:hypothetical protein